MESVLCPTADERRPARRSNGYPRRRPCHAQRVLVAMFARATSRHIGANACWLITLIAAQEAANQYAGPCEFFDHELMPLAGARNRYALDAWRRAAVRAGWLHYEPAGDSSHGDSSPAIYWTNIPSDDATEGRVP